MFVAGDVALHSPLLVHLSIGRFVPLLGSSTRGTNIMSSQSTQGNFSGVFYPPASNQAFWAAAPKGRCPVGHRGEFPYVRPSVRPSVRTSVRTSFPKLLKPLKPQVQPLRPQIWPHRPQIWPLRPQIWPSGLKSSLSGLKSSLLGLKSSLLGH